MYTVAITPGCVGLVKSFHLAGYLLRKPQIIGIYKSDEFAAGMAYSGISCGWLARIGLIDIVNFGKICLYDVGGSVEYVDEPLAAYRVHAEGMSKVWLTPKILESHLSVLSNALSQLQGSNARIANAARANIYFKVGLSYLKRGEQSAGRRMLFRALLEDPLQLRFYVYQSISLLPTPFVRAANVLRHRYFRALKPTP